jgi:hypothetical protein
MGRYTICSFSLFETKKDQHRASFSKFSMLRINNS